MTLLHPMYLMGVKIGQIYSQPQGDMAFCHITLDTCYKQPGTLVLLMPKVLAKLQMGHPHQICLQLR